MYFYKKSFFLIGFLNFIIVVNELQDLILEDFMEQYLVPAHVISVQVVKIKDKNGKQKNAMWGSFQGTSPQKNDIELTGIAKQVEIQTSETQASPVASDNQNFTVCLPGQLYNI